jgi:DNA-binding response OmpR family regulator
MKMKKGAAQMYNLLLVEDDKDILQVNANMLRRHGGYHLYLAQNLGDARKIFADADIDMAILDIMLPDGSGLDFLEEIKQTPHIPVLLLTALSEADDEVKGLKAGGDDYLAKPYDINVLLARVEIMLRKAATVPEIVKQGDFILRVKSGQVFINGQDLLLAKGNEFLMFMLFVKNQGKLLSPKYIYDEVWGRDMIGDDNAVRRTVNRLQARLKNSGYTIINEYGKGYCFEKD